MNIANVVSETALITLMARAKESQKSNGLLKDPMGVEVLDKLQQELPESLRSRILARKMPGSLSSYITLRARYYDRACCRFLEAYPDGLVVSLGCGFDTRYFRVPLKGCNYLEVDLPDVIAAKREILGERATFSMIGCSVLEDSWLHQVKELQSQRVLFLAEGLLMYLPPDKVRQLFQKISQHFSQSQMVFEVVHKKYTSGLWKKIVISKMKRRMGTSAGAAYDFGVADAREIESFGAGLRVTREWSYFEDPDIKPSILGWFKNWKFVTRNQWTIWADVGASNDT